MKNLKAFLTCKSIREMVLSMIAITIAVGLITEPSGQYQKDGQFILAIAFMM